MKQDTILIIGASGTVGSELTNLLRAESYNLKLATSKKAVTPEQVQINVATGEGIKEAFSNIDKAYLLSPPGFADHYAVLSPLIQEAKRQGLKKVVLMSAMGANADETSPFRRAEIELESSGLNYNIIRPNWFLQNFNTFWIQGINEQSKILLPVGNAKTSFIDARDIAAVAAKLLTSDDFNNQDIDITGPEALSHDEVAEHISKATNRKIEYQEIEPQSLKDELLQAGLPEDYVNFLLLILGFLKEGYNSAINDNVEKVLGRKPRSITDYVSDYKASWLING